MRKAQKQEILEMIKTLQEAHEEIKASVERRNTILAQSLLEQCQECAISIGTAIENFEGEGFLTVSYIETYCDVVFSSHEELNDSDANANKIYKNLKKHLLRIENSVKNDVPVRKEIAFFPYKASMWDSLESVYLAAKKDPDCDAYCVPIPYYDLKPDHSFGEMHYEGREYPKNIEVIDWRTYNFEERKPDVIYIHNPYDNWNLVTSVEPRYYSNNLKKYTETLVYVPYYSTAGGMSEGQRLCPAYMNADYIVIQAPKYRDYFDERIPDKKFLPFGSPKFDKVIRKCQNPPEPPREWKEKIKEKKVYFYNTSISGMLSNTEDFLKKMYYVFSCFEGRKDSCLLWRPHPLLESTFDSMRPQYKQAFEALKRAYIESNIGIYDDTPDITDAIALSDAYIGDAGTSVTSLFGIAGKPLFILNNKLHSEPTADSWRGEISAGFNFLEQDRFAITQGNKLYCSEPFAYDYKYKCDLSKYAYGGYYLTAYEIAGKIYVCPANAQDILVVGENGVERKIELEKKIEKTGAFCRAWKCGKYLVLIPAKYPTIVRYDTTNDEIKYIDVNQDIFIKEDKGETKIGGYWFNENYLYLASPTDNQICKLDIEKGESQIITLPIKSRCGCLSIIEREGELWLMPYSSDSAQKLTIICWNPEKNEAREYNRFPKDLACTNPVQGCQCMDRPFNTPAFYGDEMYLTPNWANMYLKLNIKTGEISQWQPPFKEVEKTEYFYTTAKSSFVWHISDRAEEPCKIYSYQTRTLYDLNFNTGESREIKIKFDVDELKKNEPGFCEYSEWLKYVCMENAFNSLKNFLDGNITGKQFDRDKQLRAYEEVAANYDGSCGQKVHDFIRTQGK